MNDTSLRNPVDTIFREVACLRDAKEFRKLLLFCSRHKNLSPYNAMLARMQRPTSRFVLSVDDWKRRFNRRPKANARPIAVLLPFAPVQYVFDIVSTEIIPGVQPIREEELHTLSHAAKPVSEIDKGSFDSLVFNMPLCGVYADLQDSSAECVSLTEDNVTRTFDVEYDRGRYCISAPLFYRLSAPEGMTPSALFGPVCAELAGLFLGNPGAVTDEVSTFERMAVAWTVARRRGFNYKEADDWLNAWIKDHKEIPEVSVDGILHAISDIERLFGYISLKEAPAYRKSPDFKSASDELIKEIKGGRLLKLFQDQVAQA